MSEYVNITPGPLTVFKLDIGSGTTVTHEHLTNLAGNPDAQVEYSQHPENLASESGSEITTVDKSDPNAETWADRFISCTASHYGLPVITGAVGAAGAYAGSTMPKSGNVRAPGSLGGGANMSRISFYTHRISRTVPPGQQRIHQRILTNRMEGRTGRIAKSLTGTVVVGRFIGRFCGPLGWVLLATDAALIANCVTNADSWLRDQWVNLVEDMIQDQDPVEQMIMRGAATGRWRF